MRGERVGFVPTMGSLHEGHLSLVRRARKECDRVVVSIFVNPLQFGPKEDYKRYPRDFGADRALLRKEKVDLLFSPSLKTMVPDLFATSVHVNRLSNALCGPFRPGHFRGVTTTCTKLFHLVDPDIVYFGQKDFQQTRILDWMLRDLNFNIQMKVLPTVREKDGLAMSSRNRALSRQERRRALLLFHALFLGKVMIHRGEKRPARIIFRMRLLLRQKGLRIDYVSIVNPRTLESVSGIHPPVLLAVAVRVGKTRLIDNVLIERI